MRGIWNIFQIFLESFHSEIFVQFFCGWKGEKILIWFAIWLTLSSRFWKRSCMYDWGVGFRHTYIKQNLLVKNKSFLRKTLIFAKYQFFGLLGLKPVASLQCRKWHICILQNLQFKELFSGYYMVFLVCQSGYLFRSYLSW